MKRWFLILLVLVSAVGASPIIPQPFCEINAEIISIDGGTASVRVAEVVAMRAEGMESGPTCKDLYLGKTINDVTLEDGEALEGVFVNGVITYFGDEFASGYSMAGIARIDPILTEKELRKEESFWPRLIAIILFLLISMTASAFIILKKHRREL